MLGQRICFLVALVFVYVLLAEGDLDNVEVQPRLTIRIPFLNDTPPDCNMPNRTEDCFNSSIAPTFYFFKCIRVWNWFQYDTILCRDVANHTECNASAICIE